MWVHHLLDDDSLRGSRFERLSRTNGEVSEQCRLAISTFAIEVFADQIGGFPIGRGENVMGANMPDCEETVSPIPDCPSVDLEAWLGAGGWQHGGEQQDVGDGESHRLCRKH